MEDILNDFLAEANDQISQVERQIVLFEQQPSNTEIIASIFRLFHTLKGTSGFLDMPRLERLSHAAESLLGHARDAGAATPEHIDLILQTVDVIQVILTGLDNEGVEPAGDDDWLIGKLEHASGRRVDAEPGRTGAATKDIHSPSDVHETPSRKESPIPDIAAGSNYKETGSIRVTLETLERIMRLVSELVLTRNQLMDISRSDKEKAINAPLQRLSAITTDLQDSIMRARMQPIDRLFGTLPRMVREVSMELGKTVNLIVEGSDTELDRQLIERIRDPLMHIVRNCIDHGLEPAGERLAAGKAATGQIRVTASQDAGFISIDIFDDGRGIDAARVRQKIVDLNLAPPSQLAAMGNDELCRYIFSPGFSTADAVTNISGRGFGMDVVRTNVESIGGTVALSTTPGRGTTITLKIPLTLAIVPALIFEVGGHEFAIPQDAVIEAIVIRGGAEDSISIVQGRKLLTLRDQVMPVVDFAQLCRLLPEDGPQENQHAGIFIVARMGSTNFAVAVDTVADVQEIVVKPLSAPLAHLDIFAGNTILGNGSVVLIINPAGLAAAAGITTASKYTVDTKHTIEPHNKSTTNFILFRGDGPVQRALPLSLLSRIEEVDACDIANGDGQLILRHNGVIMPLLDLAGFSPERTRWPVLVVGVGGEPFGLLVSQIIDTVEHALEIDIPGRTASVIGSTTIGNEITEILDPSYYMQLARPDAFARRHAHKFRVLVVDDKPFFRDMLSPILGAAGYEVNTAASAQEAINAIRRGGQFDAILTDVDMPDINGYELAATLRDIPAYRDKPIIALDAYAGREVRNAAQAVGMNDVVGKFDRKSIIASLQDCLDASAFNRSAIEDSMLPEKVA